MSYDTIKFRLQAFWNAQYNQNNENVIPNEINSRLHLGYASSIQMNTLVSFVEYKKYIVQGVPGRNHKAYFTIAPTVLKTLCCECYT